MADEPTNWELKRNYEGLRTDMRDGFNQINSRLDKMPNSELFAALLANLERRIKEVEQDFENEQKRRTGDRRLVVGAALAAIGALVTQVISSVLAAKGIG